MTMLLAWPERLCRAMYVVVDAGVDVACSGWHSAVAVCHGRLQLLRSVFQSRMALLLSDNDMPRRLCLSSHWRGC